jgi:hypothetical protein
MDILQQMPAAREIATQAYQAVRLLLLLLQL